MLAAPAPAAQRAPAARFGRSTRAAAGRGGQRERSMHPRHASASAWGPTIHPRDQTIDVGGTTFRREHGRFRRCGGSADLLSATIDQRQGIFDHGDARGSMFEREASIVGMKRCMWTMKRWMSTMKSCTWRTETSVRQVRGWTTRMAAPISLMDRRVSRGELWLEGKVRCHGGLERCGRASRRDRTPARRSEARLAAQ